jgi:two-component system cell cycle response regulator DivK
MGRRILIVDDNARVRHLVSTYLESRLEFVLCDEAGDGIEAIERARQSAPDVVVMDVSMPRMNGLEASSVLRRILGDVPIILFTSYEDALSQEQLRSIGIHLVVSKARPIEILAKDVQRLLAPAQSASPGLES